MARFVYGIENSAYMCGADGEGEILWYTTRRARNIALDKLRIAAIIHGLSRTSAEYGIRPVKRHINSEIGKAWLATIKIESEV